MVRRYTRPAARACSITWSRSASKAESSRWQWESRNTSVRCQVPGVGQTGVGCLLQPCAFRHIFLERDQHWTASVADRRRHDHAVRLDATQLARLEVRDQ